MDIQITGRNVTVSEELKSYVEGRAEATLVGYPRIESCHVILSHEKYRCTVEFVVQGRDKLREVAQETTDDMYAAVDAAAEKLDKQLRKAREKMIDRHHDRQRLSEVEKSAGGEAGV
ncbi:MAG: ribosome-associated translation inhibitor RaiA [Lentisphaerae bacterium]|nr:ribosome-associated translation inhibitor RaiA [Lentisphaerota bacterium]